MAALANTRCSSEFHSTMRQDGDQCAFSEIVNRLLP
jgi:hypothetical protein